jgi:hypothetical protein
MAKLDFTDCSGLRSETKPADLQAAPDNSAALFLPDGVPWDCPGAREIGSTIPERYNASAILFGIVLMLRNEISASRHAHTPARRAAHA